MFLGKQVQMKSKLDLSLALCQHYLCWSRSLDHYIGQSCLTTILNIHISVIRCHRKMIIFLFSMFLGKQVQMKSKLDLSLALCQHYLCWSRSLDHYIGQSCLTTILNIHISVIRCHRKMIIFLFSMFLGKQVQMKSKLDLALAFCQHYLCWSRSLDHYIGQSC